MAQQRLVIDGFGQLELNNAAFRRDGRVEAQCALNSSEFSASVPAENGMVLAVEKAKKQIRFMLSSSEVAPLAINYTAEHYYDERNAGLKNFKLTPADGFYPRVGYPAVGDIYTTNTVSYDSTVDTGWTTDALFKQACGAVATTPLYGGPSTDGSILISATAPAAGLTFAVVGATTMPDGQFGVKLQVIAV